VPWEEIVRFGACEWSSISPNTFRVFYSTKPFPKEVHFLPMNMVSGQEYERIVADIRRAIGDRYPNLVIGGYEVMPD
jgi:hypothetical protein